MGSFPWPREGERRGKEGHLGCPEGLKLVQSSVQREQSVTGEGSLGPIPSEGLWKDVMGPAPQSR